MMMMMMMVMKISTIDKGATTMGDYRVIIH